MEHEVQQIVYGEPQQAAAATAAVLAALAHRSLSVLGLVALLRQPLTDDLDHEARARAVQLLSQVAEQVPAALLKGDVEVMAEFLGGKLQDWRCVAAAIPGCRALLQRHRQPSLAELPPAAALQLVASFCQVHAQGLDYRGRLACYATLQEVLEGPHGVAAALAGSDLVGHTWASMEKETDPRCVLAGMACVEAVARLYQRPELASVSHLSDNLEDIFDVGVSSYFPVMFTPPRDAPGLVTREQLLAAAIGAMASCPQFAALAIPLLSEKLGSSLKQAKLDSLQALPVCLKAWGPAAAKPHMQAIWLMLKAELMAPAAAADAGPDQLASKYAMAVAAATALTQSVAALGPGLLDKQVLHDVAVEDLQQYLGLQSPPWAADNKGAAADNKGAAADNKGAAADKGVAAGWDLDTRAQARLVCIARIVAAVAAAGGASCDAVCKEILGPAVTAVLQDTPAAMAAADTAQQQLQPQPVRPLQADCAVLCVLHSVLEAVAHAAASDGRAKEPTAGGLAAFAGVCQLAPGVAQLLQRLQHWLARQEAAGDADADMFQARQMQLWLLLLWQDLLSLHNSGVGALQQDSLDAAAQQLGHEALHGSSVGLQLQLAPQASGACESAQAAAARGLELLAQAPASAGAAASQPLQQFVAPVLLQLLQGPEGSSSSGGHDDQQQPSERRALELLQQLAGSSAAAGWQVLCWLQPLVLKAAQLQQAARLCKLLPILHSHCLPALPADLAPEQSAAAASFCAALLECWQQHGSSHSDGSDAQADALVQSCILLAQLTSRCSSNDQQQLLLTGCEWVTTSAVAAVPASLPSCLGAAVLAAARPGLLTAASVEGLLQTLAGQAIDITSSSSSSWLNRLAAGVALAGIINKSCGASRQGAPAAAAGVTPDALLQAVLPGLLAPVQLLQQALQRAAAPAPGSGSDQQQLQQVGAAAVAALQALAWLSRGLAMQRHDAWQQCMQQVLLLLAQPQAAPQQHSSQLLWAAADYFSVLVATAAPSSSNGSSASSSTSALGSGAATAAQLQASPAQLGLLMSNHSMARPLWQQKAFTLALQAQQAAVAGAPGSGPPAGLQVAAACLLAAAPASTVAGAREEAVPLLLQCLTQLVALWKQQAGLPAMPGVLRLLQLPHSCLLLLADALMTAASEAAGLLQLHVEQLLAALCELARLVPARPAAADGQQQQQQPVWYQVVVQAAAVREVALMCLTSVMAALPYHLLHPHRRGVLAVVSAALDDDRRAVRRAAVVCRAAWTVS